MRVSIIWTMNDKVSVDNGTCKAKISRRYMCLLYKCYKNARNKRVYK